MKLITRVSTNLRVALLVMIASFLAIGCATDGQTGALAGGGLGALLGQAIGHDTKATLIGAGIGTGLGFIIGNERDKREVSRYSQSSYSYDENEILEGSRWRLVTMFPRVSEPFESKIIEFKSRGRMSTITTKIGGYVSSTEEQYRIVGNLIIVNKPDYIINANFKFSGNKLMISADDFSAVLEKI
jgi:glucokinase